MLDLVYFKFSILSVIPKIQKRISLHPLHQKSPEKTSGEAVSAATASRRLCWSAKQSRGGSSESVCVCDVWSPGATNGAGESRGHYTAAMRALETLPTSLHQCPPDAAAHKDTSVAAMKTACAESGGQTGMREDPYSPRTHKHTHRERGIKPGPLQMQPELFTRRQLRYNGFLQEHHWDETSLGQCQKHPQVRPVPYSAGFSITLT